MHPDFGGDTCSGCDTNYGFSYIQADGTQPKVAVNFSAGWPDDCDGADHATGLSFPFYPIPDEAITTAHWVASGCGDDLERAATHSVHAEIPSVEREHADGGQSIREADQRGVCVVHGEVAVLRHEGRDGLAVVDV